MIAQNLHRLKAGAPQNTSWGKLFSSGPLAALRFGWDPATSRRKQLWVAQALARRGLSEPRIRIQRCETGAAPAEGTASPPAQGWVRPRAPTHGLLEDLGHGGEKIDTSDRVSDTPPPFWSARFHLGYFPRVLGRNLWRK